MLPPCARLPFKFSRSAYPVFDSDAEKQNGQKECMEGKISVLFICRALYANVMRRTVRMSDIIRCLCARKTEQFRVHEYDLFYFYTFELKIERFTLYELKRARLNGFKEKFSERLISFILSIHAPFSCVSKFTFETFTCATTAY